LLSGGGIVETLVLASSAEAVEVRLLEVFMEHHIMDDRVKVAIQFDSGSQVEPTHQTRDRPVEEWEPWRRRCLASFRVLCEEVR
jgi:hypothetical protein